MWLFFITVGLYNCSSPVQRLLTLSQKKMFVVLHEWSRLRQTYELWLVIAIKLFWIKKIYESALSFLLACVGYFIPLN